MGGNGEKKALKCSTNGKHYHLICIFLLDVYHSREYSSRLRGGDNNQPERRVFFLLLVIIGPFRCHDNLIKKIGKAYAGPMTEMMKIKRLSEMVFGGKRV